MTEVKGLTGRVAAERLEKEGKNSFPEGKRETVFRKFLAQFKDVIIIMLIAGAMISLILGEIADSIVIMVIVLMNGTLGFIQEYRTERSLEALKNLSAPVCTVIRDGERRNIAAENLVREDVVVLNAGDRVPADCTIITRGEIAVNEAVLTGESLPVHKDYADMLYMGTGVCSGKCNAQVTATGMNTKMGEVAGMLKGGDEETPLKKRMNKIGKMLVGISLGVCVVIAFAGIYYGQPLSQVFFSAVSLAVAAIPEGLPAAVTLCLAIGVGRMLKRNALIRKLPAVETLGCTTVICSDKTGTLTQNKMTVVSFYAGEREEKEADGTDMEMLCTVGGLCLDEDTNNKTGDPTERAIWTAVEKYRDKLGDYVRKSELPFTSERKAMSVCYEKGGEGFIAVKGAPDRILGKCTKIFIDGEERDFSFRMREKAEEKMEDMAAGALRVIAFAYRKEKTPVDAGDIKEQNLVFVGFMGMIDPPRPQVSEAIKMCYKAGIRPIMITGDHSLTATEVAKQIGIKVKEDGVLTGAEIDALSERELAVRTSKVSVFARVSPEHKLKVVRALKSMGHIVAMTGDGVNDAPALKEADIGVAMGKSGTDVAKEAATVVLTDDNFATIVAAVEEGRTIFNNIRKFIRYLLACNLGEILLMGCAAFMGLPIPLLPIQILWVNLVTDGLPALALGMCPGEKNSMEMPPRNPRESFFSGGLGGSIIFSGLIIGCASLIAFVMGYRIFGDVTVGRSACFAVLIISELFFALECRSERRYISIFENKYLLLATGTSFSLMIAVMYMPILSELFQVVPPSLELWVRCIGLALIEPLLQLCLSGKKGKVIKKGEGA